MRPLSPLGRALPGRFEHRLLLVVLAGLAIRIAYAIWNRHYPVIGDAMVFHLDAQHLADGHGFQRPYEPVPTAEHPPVFIVMVAALDVVGAKGFVAHRLAMAVVGTVTVALLGLLGRRVAGPRAGLIAAAIAAVYPLLWVVDGSLMSETAYGVTVVLVLLAAYGFLDRPTWRRAALLGGAIGLATLTRAEALWLIPILCLPLAWRYGGSAWRPRARAFAVMAAAFVLVLAPWTVRNLLTFEEPILVSTNGYGVLVGANNHTTYYTDQIGSWIYTAYRNRAPGDESQYSVDYRNRGLRYARHHLGRLPVVMAARLGRMWDVFHTEQQIFVSAAEGRRPRAARWGLRTYRVLALLAIAGLVVLRRRRQPLLVLLAPIVLVTWSALIVYGSSRLRYAAEPALVVLGAVAVDASVRAAEAWRARRGRAAEAEPPPVVATPA